MKRRLDEVQKKYTKPRRIMGTTPLEGPPFIQEIQDKLISLNFRLSKLEAYDGGSDPVGHVIIFRAQMASYGTSDKLSMVEKDITPMTSALIGFTGDYISPLGTTTLLVTIGEESRSKTMMITFMVVSLPSAYNIILGLPTLNKLRVVVSTYHQAMKFFTRSRIGKVRSDLKVLRQCYLMTTSLPKKLKSELPIVDPQDMTKAPPHPESTERVLKVSLDKSRPDKVITIGSTLPKRDQVQPIVSL
ncbi:hypothetical protein B296_00025109 [Ensete ventricosum]|uniref:Reverse transcriptase domain-containing protein n=1 Tax=Ensete ventricosum TaxID=4639 RepID=A0A426ZB03_ENSVE|nr:hypothetical protein B296_00025109 [Ensete ventricosum]